MKRIVKCGMYAFLCAALSTSLVACGDDDPNYDNVIPPTVAVTHSVSGRVTAMDGQGIKATISMDSNSKTTNDDGTFVFENVAAGTYKMKAEAAGKISQETSITVNGGSQASVAIWNVTLINEGVKLVVEEDGSSRGSAVSETIKNNEKGAIEMTAVAPEDAVEEGETIIITPVYTTNDATTRATSLQSLMLIGTKVSCSNSSATLKKPISLSYDVEEEIVENITAQKLVNGAWVEVPYTKNSEGQVVVEADSFTSYSLLLTTQVTSSTTSEPLSFQQSEWNNLYGTADMSVASASYTYKIGCDITSSGTNRTTAYLIEILARMAGATSTTVNGSYPINVTLPVGTALEITGRQTINTLSVSSLGRTVSGKQYGDVAVITRTWNRQHTGGGN